MSSYLSLCAQVYDLSKPTAPDDAYEFYKSYVIESQGLILEPMCGTGRFMIPLLKEGYAITGFDVSQHMLNALCEKASSEKLKFTVWRSSVENFQSSDKYNLIFIPSGSFGLIRAAQSALRMFYNYLNEYGILVFEVETFVSIPQNLNAWKKSSWKKDDGDLITLNSLNYLSQSNLLTSIGKYELVKDNKIIKTEIEELKIRLYDSLSITKLLKSVGFKNIKVIKAFDRAITGRDNDEVIVLECHR